MNDRLSPIATPASRRWRAIRLQYFPFIVFLLGLVAAAVIWTRWVAPPTLVGEAEAIRTEVRSAQPGRIVGLEIDVMQSVKAGQVLGHVLVSEPQVLETALATLRAEIALMRATRDPVIGQQRAALDLEQVQLDWMRQRVELASLRGQLQQAETTLARSVNLQQQRMISDEQFDLAKNTRDSLAAQVKAQAELIQQMEPRLRELGSLYETAGATPTQGLAAAVQHKEAELKQVEAELGPVPLVAPIDGVVTLLLRRSGETVAGGEPILQISASRPDRIVGFVRQPITVNPKPGMTVEVRTRTFQRRVGQARIVAVGQLFEPISPTLLAAMRLPISTVPTEFGLRVHVSAPNALALRPGEQVDLIIQE